MSLFAKLTFGVVAPATVAAGSAGYVVPMFGVTPSAFVLAAIGAVMSYVWDEREKTPLVLVYKCIGVTLFSVCVTIVIPDIVGWTLRPGSVPPAAFLVATFARWIIPALKNMAPTIARGFVNMVTRGSGGGSYGGGYGNDYDDPRDANPYSPKRPRPKDGEDDDDTLPPPTPGGY